jgi:hypothetical protein
LRQEDHELKASLKNKQKELPTTMIKKNAHIIQRKKKESIDILIEILSRKFSGRVDG